MSEFKIAAFGDSLMTDAEARFDPKSNNAFPQVLENKLHDAGYKNVEVLPFGSAGMTTGGARGKVDAVLDSKPDLVILEFGTNDADDGKNIAPAIVRQNIELILNKIVKTDYDGDGAWDVKVLLAGTLADLPPDGDQWKTKYTAEEQAEFNSIYENLAKLYGFATTLYPDFRDGVWQDYENKTVNLDTDKLHPNEAGVRTIVDKILPYVKPLIPGPEDDLIKSGNADPNLSEESRTDYRIPLRANGGPGNDTLIGQNGLDYLDGGDGNDSMIGGADGDDLRGGTGNDFIRGGPETYGRWEWTKVRDNVPIETNPQDPNYHPIETFHYEWVHARVWRRDADDKINGQDGDDTLWGDAGNDIIIGEDGEDSVLGGTGNDYITGGDDRDWLNGQGGNDTIYGDEGDDVIIGEDGADLVFGGTENDYITGGDNKDWLNGQGGNDTIYGDEGDDVIIGEDGADLIFGGTADDYITGGDNKDWLNGQGGNDTIYGDEGDDVIIGEDGADLIFGGTENDYITGGDNKDWLNGQRGNDTIYGDEGDDVIIGEDGEDTAAFAGFRADYVITPFGDGHFTVVDNDTSDGDDGTDDLYSVEFAQFQDMTVQLSDVSRDLRMEWWDDANFGMFIHWGLYAIPAGTWSFNGDKDDYPDTSEWILAKLDQSEEDPTKAAEPRNPVSLSEYMALQDQFNPTQFNAAEWIDVAERGGAEYVVVTAKHHDGFCMWDTDVDGFQYNLANTPFGAAGRDPLGELEAAAREAGLKFGLYYSIVDWSHPALQLNNDFSSSGENALNNYPRISSEFSDKAAYKADMKAQLDELIDRYDPDILWFDGAWAGNPAYNAPEAAWTQEDAREIEAHIRSRSPDIILNSRVDDGDENTTVADYISTSDNTDSVSGGPRYWESPYTINNNWGYNKGDVNWKSEDELRTIADNVISNGGNLLLNVGPTADGEIPDVSADRFVAVGKYIEEYWG